MIRRFVLKRLDRMEQELGGSVEEFRHALRVSWGAFLRLYGMAILSGRRGALPAQAFHVGRLVVVQALDCGSCVQSEVTLAKRAGVPPEQLRAVLERKPEALPEPLREVYRFAEGVILGRGEEDHVREAIRRRYGERGLVELAMAVATRGVFPLAKRGLGHLTSCSRTPIKV